jgi:hypothetical protein
MKNSKKPIYVRYEFSNEAGRPEGGDILTFSTLEALQAFAAEALEVSLGDEVAVNLTIGREPAFFGFLKSVGISRKVAEEEMVTLQSEAPATKKKSTAKSTTKAAKKVSSSKKKPKSKAKSSKK